MKKKKGLKALLAYGIFFSVGVFLLLYFISYIQAQNVSSTQSLEVSPPSQELTADPGKTVVVKALLRNKSKDTLPVSVRIEDFSAVGEEGQVALSNTRLESLRNWSSLSVNKFTLSSGQEQLVEAKITLPSGSAGGQYGSFVFSVQPQNPRGGQAAVAQEIASLFLIKVNGQVNESLTLDRIQVPRFSEFGPIPLSTTLTNRGNVHSKVVGVVNITDMFGNKVTDLVVPATNVFPNATRRLTVTVPFTYLFGKYTATAILYYGSVKNETLSASASFIVVPVRIIVGIVILVWLLFIARKRIGRVLNALFK